MNQNKLLYNIVKIAATQANDYDPTIKKHMARQMGEQASMNYYREQERQRNLNKYMAEGRMTPEEAQKRLNASRNADWGIKADTALADAQRFNDYTAAANSNLSNLLSRNEAGFAQDLRNGYADARRGINKVITQGRSVANNIKNKAQTLGNKAQTFGLGLQYYANKGLDQGRAVARDINSRVQAFGQGLKSYANKGLDIMARSNPAAKALQKKIHGQPNKKPVI